MKTMKEVCKSELDEFKKENKRVKKIKKKIKFDKLIGQLFKDYSATELKLIKAWS